MKKTTEEKINTAIINLINIIEDKDFNKLDDHVILDLENDLLHLLIGVNAKMVDTDFEHDEDYSLVKQEIKETLQLEMLGKNEWQ